MGYCAVGCGTIIMKKPSDSEIRKILDTLDLTDANFLDSIQEYCNFDDFNITETIPTLVFDIGANQRYYDDEIREFLLAIESYVISGELNYEGEDQTFWRFYFRNGHWYEDTGTITYEDGERLLL